jgi:hypothetical protein
MTSPEFDQPRLDVRDQLAQLLMDFGQRMGGSPAPEQVMNHAHRILFDSTPEEMRTAIAWLKRMEAASAILDRCDEIESFERLHNSHGVAKVENRG